MRQIASSLKGNENPVSDELCGLSCNKDLLTKVKHIYKL